VKSILIPDRYCLDSAGTPNADMDKLFAAVRQQFSEGVKIMRSTPSGTIAALIQFFNCNMM
jgi:hypothetical protein